MKILSELERAEQILTEKDMEEFVHPVTQLPVASKSELGKAYVMSAFQVGFIPTKTYKCVQEGSAYVWKLINYYEADPTDPCKYLWANCVRDEDTGRATVYLHWTDPDDKPTAHWAYSVVIKKKGNIPLSIYDGEIVGYSSVRNQYSKKQGFVDSIDADCVDDNDILEDLEIEVAVEYVPTKDTHRNINKQYYVKEGTAYREAKPKDYVDGDFKPGTTYYENPNRYYYNVFAVSVYGKWVAGEGCGPELTWKKYQELVQRGVGNYALDVGDVVQVRHDGLGTTIDMQVVAYDNPIPPGKEHGATFMSCDVLFRGSFDHKEKLYARTVDVKWDPYKPYFNYNATTSEYVTISSEDRRRFETIAAYEASKGTVYERCYTSEYLDKKNNSSIFGRNTWKDSNARQWLNSTSDSYKWFVPQHLFDTYPITNDVVDIVNEGAYGCPAIDDREEILFPGFLHGLEEELMEVMARVNVYTTKPVWDRAEDEPVGCYEPTLDYVFLPAYIELFGKDEAFPADVSEHEGEQFEIYSRMIASTRMKRILSKFNTTPGDVGTDRLDNLASWWMRTPARMKMRDPGTDTFTDNEVDCVEIVTNEERRYDVEHQLGEDGGTGRQAYMPGKDTSTAGKTDIPRDVRRDKWTPVGTELKFVNNTSPGFVPCLVVA